MSELFDLMVGMARAQAKAAHEYTASAPLPGSPEYEQAMMEWDLLRVESEVNSALQHKAPQHRGDQPDPNWLKGRCPACGSPLVANLYYKGGVGYKSVIECWNSLGSFREPSCNYRRILG